MISGKVPVGTLRLGLEVRDPVAGQDGRHHGLHLSAQVVGEEDVERGTEHMHLGPAEEPLGGAAPGGEPPDGVAGEDRVIGHVHDGVEERGRRALCNRR
jgi:hypothetical protein